MTSNRALRVMPALPLPEFIALLAFLFATVAFSIDAMLPALPQIAAELTPEHPNRAQLMLTSFVAGMGLGTLFAGPISDAIGRKRAIFLGAVIYIGAALVAMMSGSLEGILAARFVQGLGASGPRIVGLALVRDLYAGREMARITSFISMIFILIPAMAPSLGAVFIAAFGWRGVFGAFIGFALISTGWLWLRQPETLPLERRRALSFASLWAGMREVLASPQVRLCAVVMTLGFGQMFALLSSAQQLFGETYGRAESFPLWFAAMALLSGSGMLFNARFVMTLGMRRIARGAYAMQVISSSLMLLLLLSGILPQAWDFAAFFIWAVSVFFMAGVTFGNLNALAMEDMAHLSGTTASVMAAISTLGAVLIAAPVGLAYNGSALPMVLATLVCSGLAWVLMRGLRD